MIQPLNTPLMPAASLQDISNERFMAMVFKDLQPQERPIVMCITDVIDKDTYWGVGTSWAPGLVKRTGNANDDEANWFFTLSTYLPEVNGQYRRTKALFHRAYGVSPGPWDMGPAPVRARLSALASLALPVTFASAQDGAPYTVVETGQRFTRLQEAVQAIGGLPVMPV